MLHLDIYNEERIRPYIKVREGESKIGQVVNFLSMSSIPVNSDRKIVIQNKLSEAKRKGIKYVLIGIPEDVGPRANHGKAGATGGWEAFLKYFLNLQSNNYINTNEVLLLGHIDCYDIQEKSYKNSNINNLRKLVEEIDNRVYVIIKNIFNNQLEPIIIGGGHNNCYPIINALSSYNNNPISIINLDVHCDFRKNEGRHSGNGFYYATIEGKINYYHIICLDELKNNQHSLESLNGYGFGYDTLQDTFIRKNKTFNIIITEAIDKLISKSQYYGVEVDMDSITRMPASAYNVNGITLHNAIEYVHLCGLRKEAKYLHLCEGAPIQHEASQEAGEMVVGQSLTTLVSTYIQVRQSIID